MAIDLQLAGKTAIVTGGSAGIGLLRSCTFSIRVRWAVPTLRNHKLFGL